jgi:murein L,D-transpeptidase YcbB/YkuD
MPDKRFLAFLFFLLLLFFSFDVTAQVSSAEKQGALSPVTYKKSATVGVKVKREKVKDERTVRVAQKTKRKKAVVVDSLKALPKNYYLGERVIMKGDSGRDVRAMARILINKLYIDEASLVYTAGDGVLYDGDLVRAVKHFQEFNGMYPDGIVGKETIKALRKRKN